MLQNQKLQDEVYHAKYIGTPEVLRNRMCTAGFHPDLIEYLHRLYLEDPDHAMKVLMHERLWYKPQLNILNEKVYVESVQSVLKTNASLKDKVGSNGVLKKFYGNTVVFNLDKQSKEKLAEIQDNLYTDCSEILSDRLDSDTFHVTLHDLAHGTQATLNREMMKDLDRWSRLILDELRASESEPLSLLGTWTMNMVNTSIVLVFCPWEFDGRNLDSWDRLSDMYSRFQLISPLDYALTPHVTLAYFKPGEYSGDTIKQLMQHIKPHHVRLTLHMKDLVLQEFESMNGYRTIY